MAKTIVNYHAYSDRPSDTAGASWPFKRMFETAMVEEDLSDGFSTVVYTPGHESVDDGLQINAGAVDRDFFTPEKMVQAGH